MIIGSAQKYSRVMQEGAAQGAFGNNAKGEPIPWGLIPARRWLGLGEEDDNYIIELVESWLDGMFSESQ